MQHVRKAAPHVRAVIKRILFIGFSVQIALGIFWMCGNFMQVQDFGEPDSALYGSLYGLLGRIPQVMYVLQLSLAFFAGYHFLQRLRPERIAFALWRGLALLTFPFAMQCHLAVQPYSFMGSLFLLMLSFLLEIRSRKRLGYLALAAVCGAGYLALSGLADIQRRESPGHSFEGAMASRFSWPTMWNDLGRMPEELRGKVEDVIWEASVCPDNMRLLYAALEDRVGVEKAREFYLEMARVGWEYHAPMIVRQIGWDILGYCVTPIVFQLQMEGDAYDAYSGRNYEIMRDHAPVLTRNYVDYSCWWFAWVLALSAAVTAAGAFLEKGRLPLRGILGSAIVCAVLSGLLAGVLTMCGAGRMDYKYTIAVNELWLIWALLLMGGERRERK